MQNNSLADYKQLIENSLPQFLYSDNGHNSELIEAMQYSLLDAGKRVRGILVLAFYDLFAGGGSTEKALPFAAAIEMIHAYSLIHDDLPCMDNDDMRRGKPSCHKQFGEDIALLAGDALLTQAFDVVSGKAVMQDFPAEIILKALSCLAKAAGVPGMIGGQLMDIKNKSTDENTLKMQDNMKTGALIRASVHMGAILAGAGSEDIEKALTYAENLGIAFQVVDDILDKTSTADKLGKPIDSDKRSGRVTYATLYGLQKAKQEAKKLTNDALFALNSININTELLEKFTCDLLTREN